MFRPSERGGTHVQSLRTTPRFVVQSAFGGASAANSGCGASSEIGSGTAACLGTHAVEIAVRWMPTATAGAVCLNRAALLCSSRPSDAARAICYDTETQIAHPKLSSPSGLHRQRGDRTGDEKQPTRQRWGLIGGGAIAL